MKVFNEFETRKKKLETSKENHQIMYVDKFDKDCELQEANYKEDGTIISICGRIISIRDFGKFMFLTLYDINGTMQISISKNELGENYVQVKQNIDNGDFLGVYGEIYTTKTGQKTVKAFNAQLLSKTLRPLPEKFHGLNNQEILYRQRYLDIISNADSRKSFLLRSEIIKTIREYLYDNGFIELETPILQNIACGANAKPFVTHHNALDEDFYLRIAPELYLKISIAAGFDKVFEIGKNFRNEGIDSAHLQEFTMVEWYVAYWDYIKNMSFSVELLQYLINLVKGDLKFDYQGVNLDFSNIDKVSYIDEISNFLKRDIFSFEDKEEIKALLRQNSIFTNSQLEDVKSMAGIIDLIFKQKIRPYIIQPTILHQYPSFMVPLARPNNDDPRILDMFQIIVNRWEVVKCYSELVDPIKQREEFMKQMINKQNGDEEAMELDENFLLAMEHGMPPISGLGMGIDRLVAILSNNSSLRDVVLFPQTKKNNSKKLMLE